MNQNEIRSSTEEDGESLLPRHEYLLPRWSSSGNGFWSRRYTRIGKSSADFGDDQGSRKTRRSPLRLAVIVLSTLCLLIYVAITAPMLVKAGLARRRFSCGATIEEAEARGCTFDAMTVQWLPKQCSRRGTEQWLNYPEQDVNGSSWRYYTDETLSKEFVNGLIDAPIGRHKYVTTRGEHLAHCAYILIRGAEARANGERVDALSASPVHTRHCALFLLQNARNADGYDTFNSPGDVMLGAC